MQTPTQYPTWAVTADGQPVFVPDQFSFNQAAKPVASGGLGATWSTSTAAVTRSLGSGATVTITQARLSSAMSRQMAARPRRPGTAARERLEGSRLMAGPDWRGLSRLPPHYLRFLRKPTMPVSAIRGPERSTRRFPAVQSAPAVPHGGRQARCPAPGSRSAARSRKHEVERRNGTGPPLRAPRSLRPRHFHTPPSGLLHGSLCT
jgi:hypothetical protein